jgi:hypothetical protein
MIAFEDWAEKVTTNDNEQNSRVVGDRSDADRLGDG